MIIRMRVGQETNGYSPIQTVCIYTDIHINVPILLLPICYVVLVEQDYHNINVMLMSLLFGKI